MTPPADSPTPEPTPADRERVRTFLFRHFMPDEYAPIVELALALEFASVRADAESIASSERRNADRFYKMLIKAESEQAAEIERLRSERDEARRYGEDMYRRAREVTCVWCGHQFESTLGEQAEHLRAHAETCEQHPLRAALAREAALVEECVAGRLAQDIFNDWAAALEGRGELPDRVRAEHLSKEYRRIRTQNESAHNSTAAAEAYTARVRREALEEAAKIADDWSITLNGNTRQAAVDCAIAIRAAAAPETPAP